jgi:hypothetical protein
MRGLSYIVAAILLLSGPSMAGSADQDLPGIGTFSYIGSAPSTQIPPTMPSIDVGH